MSRNALTAIIETACNQNRKIEAIKLVRQYNGMGLKEAKDFVEAMQYLNTKAVAKFIVHYNYESCQYEVRYVYDDGQEITLGSFPYAESAEKYAVWRNSKHDPNNDSAYVE